MNMKPYEKVGYLLFITMIVLIFLVGMRGV